MLLYSTLYLTGYGLTLDDLKNFRQLGSPTAGHPEYGHAAGIETTTGPLGQGISTAVGLALAERLLAARFNRDGHEIVDHYTYVIASDGDLQEGVASEASSLAGHLGLGKLISFWDDNHISIEGDTALSFTEDVASRYEAYGWHVQNLGEDIGLDASSRRWPTRRDVTDRPSTDRRPHAHRAPARRTSRTRTARTARRSATRRSSARRRSTATRASSPFFVADEALEHFRAGDRTRRRGRGRVARALRGLPAATSRPRPPSTSASCAATLPEDWDADVPKKTPDAGMIATRKASHDVIQWAAAQVPELVGGSADLAPSTLTLIDGADSVERGSYGGRNLHFGIREHAWGRSSTASRCTACARSAPASSSSATT